MEMGSVVAFRESPLRREDSISASSNMLYPPDPLGHHFYLAGAGVGVVARLFLRNSSACSRYLSDIGRNIRVVIGPVPGLHADHHIRLGIVGLEGRPFLLPIEAALEVPFLEIHG